MLAKLVLLSTARSSKPGFDTQRTDIITHLGIGDRLWVMDNFSAYEPLPLFFERSLMLPARFSVKDGQKCWNYLALG
ncbi:hypothetical protein H6S82_25195 [Planktothrix sp. FACHB-1355]|uniref:Uncharacterized protein n=1 Tax=Aerosakkonema funiforme FACHB-1375 TaxID=2949571 RepID=A0A926VFM5_9CYAN|nr:MULTISPECIES: hypothetical protein [Oscillatoriales]MBD2182833.1 hypothetical protein [Aerosakkonema funiforme FACHB-1375]MBD3562117.1 hypothetical protein [Planktothrix sp. FACHB-1355]